MGAIIVRYSEVGLKGANRIFYEKRLARNIRLCLKDNSLGLGSVRRIRNRLIVEAEKEAIHFLKNIFGISSLSYAESHPANLEDIKKAALEYVRSRQFGTFRITSQRLDTRFPLSSTELDKTVGEVIFETLKKKVSLTKPDLNIGIEIADKAYLFSERVEGFGGLPIGTQSRVLCLLDTKESLLSAALMMKRGCSAALCSLKDFNIGPLKKFGYGMIPRLRIISSLTELDKLAAESKAKAIVVPDKIGTLKDYQTVLPVLRPLVGFDEAQLKTEYKKYLG